MLRLKQNKYGIWQISGSVPIWRDGKLNTLVIRKSTRTSNKSEAQAIKRQIENEAVERNTSNREPVPSFREAARRYIKSGGEERFLIRIIDNYGHLSTSEFTQQTVDRIADTLYSNCKRQTALRQCYTPVIAVLSHIQAPQKISKPKVKEGKRTYFFTPTQADKLIKSASASRYPNPWTPALFTFLFSQGSRVGETIGISGNDVNLNSQYAMIRDTKNGHERMVKLTNRTCAALQHIPNLGQDMPLFLRYDGRPYTTQEGRSVKINSTWNRALESMDMDKTLFTPHTARHSWATWFYSQTKDVQRLKSEGGWKSSEWERYVQLSSPALGEEAKKYGFDFDVNEAQYLQHKMV